MNHRIYLSPPHLSGQELVYTQNAIKSEWLAPNGEYINAFEAELQQAVHSQKLPVALNSGTSALHLALLLLGIKKGDKVICQANSFIATANPIYYCGAEPIFVDSELETWNICPSLLEESIIQTAKDGNKPKAIITVHIYGMPNQVDEIQKLSEKYEIPIIEDAAEALGSKYQSKFCGDFGKYSILSFNGNKIITTSAGGALLVNNLEEKDEIIQLASQSKNSGNGYIHDKIGFNYRMSNVLAALGSSQLSDLDNRVAKRREIFDIYKSELTPHTPLKFQPEKEHSFPNRWLTSIITQNQMERDGLVAHLEMDNIESRKNWLPLNQQHHFKECTAFDNGNTTYLSKNGLCLPSGSNLTEPDLGRVIDRIKDFYK